MRYKVRQLEFYFTQVGGSEEYADVIWCWQSPGDHLQSQPRPHDEDRVISILRLGTSKELKLAERSRRLDVFL